MGQGCYLDKETIYTLNLMPLLFTQIVTCNSSSIIVYTHLSTLFFTCQSLYTYTSEQIEKGGGG